MRQNLPILITFLVLSLFTLSAVAQDSASALGTSQENACNEGGILFRDGVSLCETEWHWECGWYIANWQNTGEVVPDWCGEAHLSSEPEEIYVNCIVVGGNEYANFGHSFFVAISTPLYSDPDCTVLSLTMSETILIYAQSGPQALDRCQMIGTMVVLTTSLHNHLVWHCIIA